jgi:tetratricopeptide (TPR) repeat protein
VAAEHVYREALERYPLEAHLYNNLAYLLARHSRKLGDALRLVRTAQRLKPVSNNAYLDTQGWILHQQGRYPEALTTLERALRQMTRDSGPALAEAQYHLGLTYWKLGQGDAARSALQRAGRADPDGRFGRAAARELKTRTLP